MESSSECGNVLGVNISNLEPHPVTGSGTITIPEYVDIVIVEMWGGGGGAGGGQSIPHPGGGGGGAWIRAAFTRPLDGKINYNVGTGGSGGFNRRIPSQPGGNSTISCAGTQIEARGGGGGALGGSVGVGGNTNASDFTGEISMVPGANGLRTGQGGTSPHGGPTNIGGGGSNIGGTGGNVNGGPGSNGEIIFFY
jgi:hypothetical protein